MTAVFSVFYALEPVENSEKFSHKHLTLIAGAASHNTGTHEHKAGVLLFASCLEDIEGLDVNTYFEGWPEDQSVLEDTDAIFLFMDGGSNHPILQDNRLDIMRGFMEKGKSLGVMHYAVEVPKDNGGEEFMSWIGGYYETHYSANPIWEAEFKNVPNHPTLKGVEHFKTTDEWYFSIRFRPDNIGVTPLLVAYPSDETRDGPYVHPRGPYNHIQEAKGESEILSWSVERDDGGRGFGYTGGHFHENWGNEDNLTYVLNSLVWLAGLDVPENGVQCNITDEDLQKNLDE